MSADFLGGRVLGLGTSVSSLQTKKVDRKCDRRDMGFEVLTGLDLYPSSTSEELIHSSESQFCHL